MHIKRIRKTKPNFMRVKAFAFPPFLFNIHVQWWNPSQIHHLCAKDLKACYWQNRANNKFDQVLRYVDNVIVIPSIWIERRKKTLCEHIGFAKWEGKFARTHIHTHTLGKPHCRCQKIALSFALVQCICAKSVNVSLELYPHIFRSQYFFRNKNEKYFFWFAIAT